MSNFTVPDICDQYEHIKIGDLFLNSYGHKNKFYGQVETVKCEHSNSVVKELVQEDGNGKVLIINHTSIRFDALNDLLIKFNRINIRNNCKYSNY